MFLLGNSFLKPNAVSYFLIFQKALTAQPQHPPLIAKGSDFLVFSSPTISSEHVG